MTSLKFKNIGYDHYVIPKELGIKVSNFNKKVQKIDDFYSGYCKFLVVIVTNPVFYVMGITLKNFYAYKIYCTTQRYNDKKIVEKSPQNFGLNV